ncbi:MAG: PASTA domain-containing protein [Flavobacteriia bacterium]|jgi:beta-lactam-binding protein with PASTA domain|nr:PASTA domain-containing protein [Flavobacteriia bacterium]NBV67392.1 PASTA domain-containing protein [Flavobacteriia bacterium]NBV92603.1 PASTA domain-containing protein [Flavobacteriia bacterium]NBY41442.1 PASTA domain-containing protein [Flavobacteriia bacterium]
MMPLLQNIKSFVLTKYFLKQLGLVVLFYVSLVFIMMVYLRFSTHHGEKIEVPNLVGKNAEEAKIILEDLGLEYQILDSVYDPSKPTGTIVSQNPMPTYSSLLFVKSGRSIALRVTKKTDMVEMPSLIHKQLKFAENILQSRGLKYIIRYQPSDEANGSVIEQLYKGNKIKEGVRIPVGATIILIVGENDEGEPIQIPNFFGMTMSDANYILDTMGVSYTFICSDCITQEDSLASKVIIQSPEFLDGQTVPKSTPFTLQFRKDFEGYIENENQ